MEASKQRIFSAVRSCTRIDLSREVVPDSSEICRGEICNWFARRARMRLFALPFCGGAELGPTLGGDAGVVIDEELLILVL